MAKEFFKAHFFPEEFSRRQVLTNRLNYYLAAFFFNAFPLPQREAGARQTLRYIGEVTGDGFSVLIFPEGVRSQDGRDGGIPRRHRDDRVAARAAGRAGPARRRATGSFTRSGKWPVPGGFRSHSARRCASQGTTTPALAKQVEEAVRALPITGGA